MEIIKQGQIPDPNYRGTCNNCNSIIEAHPDELATYAGDQRNDPSGAGTCPVCKKSMNFYPKQKNTRYYNN